MSLPENVPTRTITLDRPRRIALTLGATRRMKETGVNTNMLFSQDGKDDTLLDHLSTLLWCMLVEDDRGDVTPGDLDELIPITRMPEIQIAIFELIAGEQEQAADVGKGSASSSKRTTRKSAKKASARS